MTGCSGGKQATLMFNDLIQKHNGTFLKAGKVLDLISRDRVRTNLLKKHEQRALAYLVQRIPAWVSSNLLTAFGFFGSIVIFGGFMLATYFQRTYLLIGVLGFAINWFGDSLDGRVAYFRNKPRKHYGFALDVTMDWISIILIGVGYIIYAIGFWELLGYGFVVMYGWEMIIALLRYKITGKYSIDSGKIGPTEVRIAISLVMVAEVILPGSLSYSAIAFGLILFLFNIIDTHKLLKMANALDVDENEKSKGS